MASTIDNQFKIALLTHLFLRRCLPTNQSKHKLQIDDYYLLCSFSNFLQEKEINKIPELKSVRDAFHLWADL